MVEGRVPQSSRQEKFQVPCMVEGRVPQSSRQERFQVPCMVEGRVPQSSGQEMFQVPCMVEGRVPQSSGQERFQKSYVEVQLLNKRKTKKAGIQTRVHMPTHHSAILRLRRFRYNFRYKAVP